MPYIGEDGNVRNGKEPDDRQGFPIPRMSMPSQQKQITNIIFEEDGSEANQKSIEPSEYDRFRKWIETDLVKAREKVRQYEKILEILDKDPEHADLIRYILQISTIGFKK